MSSWTAKFDTFHLLFTIFKGIIRLLPLARLWLWLAFLVRLWTCNICLLWYSIGPQFWRLLLDIYRLHLSDSSASLAFEEKLLKEGKGLKSKITNCHLIWQLECSFDVWRTTTPQCKETLTLQCNQEPCQSAPGTVSMLLCAWIGFLLGTKGQSEYVSVKGFPVPYSQDCCLLGADEAKQTVYSEHFALEQFILLSVYCRGFF